ncbi:MAG: peptide chain release factor N(5)-glutamine methyltransferase [Hespellia sp.]|nr:peptide chain release factor N(5)-glutamine methyltransferase [Hespellia sp.]
MTYKEALKKGRELLEKAGLEEASTDAWLLLQHRTGISRSQYFLRERDEVQPDQETQYFDDLARRKRHIPLQHITGVQEFMGLEFMVNEDVLIPRQDTECVVEEAVKYLQDDMKVLDMCTGSGCIVISLADAARQKRFRNMEFTGADISEKALRVSGFNAEKLQADVTFVQSDLFENVTGQFDLIVSNPPYIRTDVIEELQDEVKLHDPYIALDGKSDGLFFYRRMVEEAGRHLHPKGRLLFEIGFDQGKAVSGLMEKAGYTEIVVKKDLAGLDRVVSGVYN